MSKTLMLFLLLVVVAVVLSALTVRAFLQERRAGALPAEEEQDSLDYPPSPPRPY
jgi:hypothetical protein